MAFRLFAVTFAVIMLLLGGMLAVLAGSFSTFYERRQIRDISADLELLRDRYVREVRPEAPEGIPSYFFQFEKDYYALTSIMTLDNNKFQIYIGGGFKDQFISAPNDLPSLPNNILTISKPAPVEQLDKLMFATMEWRNDKDYVNKVMLEGDTLVFRAKGIGPSGTGANQLVAVTRINGDNAGNGKVLFAVSSLQPINNAASIIRDFSFYVFGAALVFVLVLAFLYAGIVTKPLRSLNLSARKLAKLDFSGRSNLDRKDEIGELGRTFDFLAGNLQRTLAELHEANDKLREDIEREKQLERSRRDFIAGVSHELKTPLSLIGGYAEGLKDNIGSGAKRESYAEIILEETKHMSAIVADMLDLSYLESGQYVLKWEVFDISSLLRESAERAESMGEDKGIRVQIRLPDGHEEELPVHGDRMRIGQVLTNLLSNAVRHSTPGGSVKLGVSLVDDGVEISVYNEGEPIPEQELTRIWRQFYRTDKSRSRESGGTGIGLAIVRQILQLHGGRCVVRNEADGVTFSFTLKVKQPVL